jgi:hypothetical protein
MNLLAESERMFWQCLPGKQTALYQRRNARKKFTVHVMPETPKPETFGFDDCTLYKTCRVLKIGLAEFGTFRPQVGDILIYDGKKHEVQNTIDGPCYVELGNYGIMLRVNVAKPKEKKNENRNQTTRQ